MKHPQNVRLRIFGLATFFTLLIAVTFSLKLSAQDATAQPPTAFEVITPENASRLEQINRFGRGMIQDVAFSPDGQQLAVASTIGLWGYDLNRPHNEAQLWIEDTPVAY